MTVSGQTRARPPVAAGPARAAADLWTLASSRPAALFLVLSAVFGLLIVALNPPLRGPDEQAHFLRIYGYATGDLVPAHEEGGRQGIHLPPHLYRGYSFFDDAKNTQWQGDGYRYAGIFRNYMRLPAADPQDAPTFVPYQGTEGYSPAAYLPEIAVTLFARALRLDFLPTIYLMRLAALFAATLVIALAIAMTPRLKWAFFAIGMLPAALYGRSVAGADGATVGYSLLIVALCLRAALGLPVARWHRSVWMTLCVLAKPSQLAFILLEFMTAPLRELVRRWAAVLPVVLPGTLLLIAWIVAVDAEMAAWRISDGTGLPAEQFRPGWKLAYMLQHPLQFPTAMLGTLMEHPAGLWRQLIGVLGWLDTPLRSWLYPLLTVTLLLPMIEKLDADRATRLRIAVWCALLIVGYTLAVFLILYMTWTPPANSVVWGVQGRYFVGILPAAAIALAALLDRQLGARTIASAAIAGGVVSAFGCVEAVWRLNW